MKRERAVSHGAWISWAILALGCGASSPEPKSGSAAGSTSAVPPSMVATPGGGDVAGDKGNPPPSAGDSGSPEVDRAIASIKAGDFRSARAGLEQAVHKNPKNGTALYYLGVALENSGDKSGAEQRYKEAVQIAPEIVEASINLGALYLDANKFDEAMTVTKGGLSKRPDDPALHANMAVALRGKGDKEGALVEYEKAVRVVGDNPDLRFAYGSLLLELGKKTQAAAELKAALAGASGNRALLASIGRALGPAGAFAECVSAFDKAIAAGDDAELHVRRGLCRHSLKDEAGARSDFETASKLDPKLPAGHYYLAESLLAAGKFPEAAKEFEAAAAAAPQSELGKRAKEQAAAARRGKPIKK